MIEKITVFNNHNVIREVVKRKIRCGFKNDKYVIYKGKHHYLMTEIPEVGFEGKCIYSLAP